MVSSASATCSSVGTLLGRDSAWSIRGATVCGGANPLRPSSARAAATHAQGNPRGAIARRRCFEANERQFRIREACPVRSDTYNRTSPSRGARVKTRILSYAFLFLSLILPVGCSGDDDDDGGDGGTGIDGGGGSGGG